jgi:hypothetical protein
MRSKLIELLVTFAFALVAADLLEVLKDQLQRSPA